MESSICIKRFQSVAENGLERDKETKDPGYPCLNPGRPPTFSWCLYADFIHPVRAYRSCNIVAASQN